MIAATPTLRIEDRAGRVHRFILFLSISIILDSARWETHGIVMVEPNEVFPHGMARWISPNGTMFSHVPKAPDDPLRGLAVLLKVHGVRAEHLLGEEPL